MAPRSSMAERRLTTTCRLAMRTAPRDSVTVITIGSSSGVRPTAKATANRKLSSDSPCRINWVSSTKRTRKPVSLRIKMPRAWTPVSKAVGAAFSCSEAAMAPKLVDLPVATTSILASPPTMLVPLNRALKASAGPVAVDGPGRFSAG